MGKIEASERLSTSIKLAIVSAGEPAGDWQRQLEAELARTGNLSDSPMRADGLVVIVDKSFPTRMQRPVQHHDDCFEAIRDALAAGKMLLPVAVENAAIPEAASLPKGIRALPQFQALALDRKSDLPGAAARLVVATKTMSRPYVPAKAEDRSVFISYRREDSWYWASLLARALAQSLAAHNVFFDMGSIAVGRRFDAEIQSRIHSATDFVILVGPAFLAPDHKGRRRLDDREDFVRREITLAIKDQKQIHIVLAGDAALPSQEELPSSIAPAFREAKPIQLTDSHAADPVARAILSSPPPRSRKQPWKPLVLVPIAARKPWLSLHAAQGTRFLTPQQKCQHLIMAAVPPLAALGWQPVDLAKSKGRLIMTRPDAEAYRFVFDFENFELVLEERARSLGALGLKRWIKRSIFPVSPDAPDMDLLRPPDRQLAAMENPAAFLDRTGRVDLDLGSQPPLRPAQADHFLRQFSQPAQRALDEQAREHARIRARGGLHALRCVHRMSLGDDVIARGIAVNPSTGRFAAASDHGAYIIDALGGTAERIGLRGNLKHLSFSTRGMLAATDASDRVSVLDSKGNELVRRRSPYSAWQRIAGVHGAFKTLSWSADDKRIAIGASDRIWIYNLGSDEFEQIALQQDGQGTAADAFFVPGSDELLILHLWKLWRVSRRTGKIGAQLDIAAGSECYDALSSVFSNASAGFRPQCLVLSPDGKSLAIGGNDAQLVLVVAETLQPTTMRVWHAPLVDGRSNGMIEALAYSPDGRRLASVANDSRLVIGDARSGDSLADGVMSREHAWHGVPVERDVCWSLDSTRIAVVNGEGGIEIWDAAVRTDSSAT